VVSLTVCAGIPPAAAQDQKEPESGKSEPGTKPPAPPPTPPPAPPSGTATTPKSPSSGKSGSTTDPAKKQSKTPAENPPGEVGLETAQTAAGTLRTRGELVSQTGDLSVQVESNYFSEFPGFDLSALTPEQQNALVEKANAVYCTCGCRGESVAKCVVLDTSCTTARGMLQKMIDAIKAAPPAAPPAGTNPKP
jgi:hypothetical protein